MKSKLKIMLSLCVLAMLFLLASCEKEAASPADNASDNVIVLRNNGNGNGGNEGGNGKGKGKNNDDPAPDPDPIEYASTYQITEYEEWDALYRFSFSVSGDLVLFQTDSTITDWGTDYWGSWDEPYAYADGIVHYFNGLTEMTYEFEELPGDMFDVNKTVNQTIGYTGDHVITTHTHLGIYSRTSE